MKFGLIYYSLICPSPQKLFSALKTESIEAYNITQSADVMTLSVSWLQKRRFERICAETKTEFEITETRGLYTLAMLAKKRIGLAAGAIVCLALILAAKNYTVSIEVLTDSEEIRSGVMSVLYDNGITTGTYIPSIDYVVVERALKQQVEGISWAGISVTDSTVIVDVVENIPEPEKLRERMPSNLIAAHSGVIEKVELYNGQLVKTIGSGVLRGEVLVSGTIPISKTVVKEGEIITEESEKYVRSIGKIYGTYTDVQTFEQPYTDTRLTMKPKKITRKYLSVFSSEIPLFFGSPKGLYITDSSYSPLEIFGEETPVGIRTAQFSEYSFETTLYTKKQAKKLAADMRENYEKNFLSDCEIKSRHTDVQYKKDKVVLTVTYEIYGVMSEESYFFIKK